MTDWAFKYPKGVASVPWKEMSGNAGIGTYTGMMLTKENSPLTRWVAQRRAREIISVKGNWVRMGEIDALVAEARAVSPDDAAAYQYTLAGLFNLYCDKLAAYFDGFARWMLAKGFPQALEKSRVWLVNWVLNNWPIKTGLHATTFAESITTWSGGLHWVFYTVPYAYYVDKKYQIFVIWRFVVLGATGMFVSESLKEWDAMGAQEQLMAGVLA